jgi:aminoglycoside phosphotransferase (APT) family kinase protein
VVDEIGFATDLAAFLGALYVVDATAGPAPGAHSFYRGGPLAPFERYVEESMATLSDEVDGDAVEAVWRAALATTWNSDPVWVHGDVANSNLLVQDGRLSAVLDFGCSAVGDPACDLAIAWTFFAGESRRAFRAALPFDADTWARGRGWALWKALTTRSKVVRSGGRQSDAAERFGWRVASRQVIEEVLGG